MGTYCSANNEVGDITGLTYSTATVPTLIQVDRFISQVENEANLILSSIGITSVTNALLSGTLSHYCATGAAAYVLRRYGKADKQDRAIDCMVEWKEWCNKIIEDQSYQKMLVSINASNDIGAQTGTAETQGYIVPGEKTPYYGIGNIRA